MIDEHVLVEDKVLMNEITVEPDIKYEKDDLVACPLVNIKRAKGYVSNFASEVSNKKPIDTLAIAGGSVIVGSLIGGRKAIRTILLSTAIFVVCVKINVDEKVKSIFKQ